MTALGTPTASGMPPFSTGVWNLDPEIEAITCRNDRLSVTVPLREGPIGKRFASKPPRVDHKTHGPYTDHMLCSCEGGRWAS
jgi:hypothetical protein